MGANQLPRSQSFTRQKPNGGTIQRWDSGLGNSNGNNANTCNSSNARIAGGGGAVASYLSRQTGKAGSGPLGTNCGGDTNAAVRPKLFYSGELTRARGPSSIVSAVSSTNSNSTGTMRDAATNTDSSTTTNATSEESSREKSGNTRFRSSVRVKKSDNHAVETKELLPKLEPARRSDDIAVDVCSGEDLQCGMVSDDLLLQGEAMCNSGHVSSTGDLQDITPSSTSAQTEKEGSSSRLLSRGGESSSFRGKQISASSRRESLSFRRETVCSSFRKEISGSFRKELGGSRRKERKATKSFQDGEVSSIASESARGSPCSIHYNQPPFCGKEAPPPNGVPWASSPSSPDTAFGKSSVPFQWEEAPGKAKTIAAAAEMALARKLVRDESLRKLNGASPRSSVDSHGSFRLDKKPMVSGTRGIPGEQQSHLQPHSHYRSEQQASSAFPTALTERLPLPPSKRASHDVPLPRMDSTSSQLIEDLKAAVVRKQVGLVVDDTPLVVKKFVGLKSDADEDVDVKSIISDYCCVGEAQIDLVAPAAAKFLNRAEDVSKLTPVKTPLAAVPFRWEDAPGKPKESVASPAHHLDAPSLALPPRLLAGCHNPSKEQAAKILQTYSGNLMDMQWNSSGNPTPHSRSRDATPTRRERTPTRRDRTPTKRDITPGKRELTPTRRESTPTRNYFPSRVVPKSGPLTLPSAAALDCAREHHSGPLRSYTNPNYLNVPPRSVSQEFARVTQDSALTVLSQDLDRSSRTISETGSGTLLSCRSSSITSQELQIVRRDSSPDVSGRRGGASECSRSSSHKCKAIVKISAPIDPLSPTSILCGPEVDSSQRTISNLSSAYAESSHSHRQETISEHTKSDSCTSSMESFVDESFNVENGDILDSSYRGESMDVLASEASQVNNASIEDGVKAIVKFCRKAKKWNKPKGGLRKNSAEPDMWAPTLATYFQKIELGGPILGKVGSQIFPESKDKDVKVMNLAGVTNVTCSPLRLIPRSGELASSTPDRLGARKPLGSMTPVHVITTCRSPSYRVMATDECLSVFCVGKVWSATKARHAKWGRKMRKSSRLMVAILGTLKRSMVLKCGKQSLPDVTSDNNLLDLDGDASVREKSVKVTAPHADAVHSLSADHQFHRPL